MLAQFKELCQKRHSIRTFNWEPVSDDSGMIWSWIIGRSRVIRVIKGDGNSVATNIYSPGGLFSFEYSDYRVEGGCFIIVF